MAEDVIYSYTDEQAIEDGVLVDVSGLGLSKDGIMVTRVTGNLWKDYSDDANSAKYCIKRILDKSERASGSKPHKGGWNFYVYKDKVSGKSVWSIVNEWGTLTMMYPEDY